MTASMASSEQEERLQEQVVGKERESEKGLATAEYAIATLGAAAFAGALLAVLKSGDVRDLLMSLIQSALSIG